MKENDIVFHRDNLSVGQLVTDTTDGILKFRNSKGILGEFAPQDFELYSNKAPLIVRLNHAEGHIETLIHMVSEHEKVIRMLVGSARI